MQKLLLLLSTFLFVGSTNAQKEIKLSDARDHVDDSVSISGWVTGTRFLTSANNPTLLLQMNGEKPNGKLILMIMNKDHANIFANHKKALNKAVHVKGKISLWNGRPMIVVYNETQIKILNKDVLSPTIYKN